MKRSVALLSIRLCVCAAMLLVSMSLSAQVELSAQVGFENRVTPGHYAQLRVEVRNISDVLNSDMARLRIIQLVGNEWRGEAVIRTKLGQVIQSDGVYEAVIPIYDPVNPLVVELTSSNDIVLARTQIDLRMTMHPVRSPVLDKTIPRFDARAAVIDPASLPTLWWALDGADSLWVASALPDTVWTAVSQWVLAGGSLVLLTGTDFHRMDSRMLRDLLPISTPVLALSDLGTSYVSGSPRQASISMFSDEGWPLLIQGSYGAGSVSLVTVQAQSLSVETLTMIAGQIASSQLISLGDATEHILGEQKIGTLDSLFVLVMMGLLALGASLCAIVGRRNPATGWIVFFSTVVALSVLSGLTANRTGRVIDVYAVNTHLYFEANVGFYAAFSSLYSRTGHPFTQAHPAGVIPIQFLPRTLERVGSFDSSTSVGGTEMRMSAGEVRHWHAYGAAASMLDIEQLSDSIIRIHNHSSLEFDAGWVLIDGMVHPLTGLDSGVHDYSIDPESAVRLGIFVGSPSARHLPALVLIRQLRQSFPLDNGVWLIAFADDGQISYADSRQKVRDITLVISRERDNRET